MSVKTGFVFVLLSALATPKAEDIEKKEGLPLEVGTTAGGDP
ncbi:MAG: hypothetical protein ACRD21_00630 [Vicinamibacteria bacterium]